MESKSFNTSKNSWLVFGKFFVTPIFAVGSGIITTVSVSLLSFVAALPLVWLVILLSAVFISETIISIYLFKKSVPETLISVFSNRDIFKGLSTHKKILLALGMFSALGGGLALGALTYTSGVVAINTVLDLMGLSFLHVSIGLSAILALVGFIAFSSLLIKWISVAIKNDAHKKMIAFFKETTEQDATKTNAQRVLEKSFKTVFVVVVVLVTVVGTIATLGTMQKGLIATFLLVPEANPSAAVVTAGVIAFGLMGVARLPWALQSVCGFFAKMGESVGYYIYKAGCRICGISTEQASLPENQPKQESQVAKPLTSMGKISAVLIHGFSFGAIAKNGGGEVIRNLLMDTHLVTSYTAAENIGQIASLSAGALMAIGIGGFTLFLASEKKSEFQEAETEILSQLQGRQAAEH